MNNLFPIRCEILSKSIARDGEGEIILIPSDGDLIPKVDEVATPGYVLDHHLIKDETGTQLFYEVCTVDGEPNLLRPEFIRFDKDDLRILHKQNVNGKD